MLKKSNKKTEFGDFQTPPALALRVCRALSGALGSPAAVLEPTCGRGVLLQAAREVFGPDVRLVGHEIDGEHLSWARSSGLEAELIQSDAFEVDWAAQAVVLPRPLLVLGNPPWVTAAALGAIGGVNRPARSRRGVVGLEAITGRSNFDVSEWLCGRLLEAIQGTDAAMAVLLKVSVARRVLRDAWARGLSIGQVAIYLIDAREHFGASVGACLLVCRAEGRGEARCPVYGDLEGGGVRGVIGVVEGELIADVEAFERTAHLIARAPESWRSGIKHDAAKVFELRERGGALFNGLGERVEVEREVLFPLMKGSQVARGARETDRWLLLPQRHTGQDPEALARAAPLAWAYLGRHGAALDGRRSAVYRGRPRFSIFGVGQYAFAPWKVAISGLHKVPVFTAVGPCGDRPVVFDDTVYFSPCASEAEARLRAELLNSEPARDFLAARLFEDAKRPVTANILKTLSLQALAAEAGQIEAWSSLTGSVGVGR